jgi:Hypervirulence associated proteins TUDOR domain
VRRNTSAERRINQMAKSLKPGDKVEWNTSQGKTSGTVQKKLTGSIKIKSQKITASEKDPKYLVTSAKSGKPAAHGAAALKKQGGKSK